MESPNFNGTVQKAPVDGASIFDPTRESHPIDESWETVDSENDEHDAILPSGEPDEVKDIVQPALFPVESSSWTARMFEDCRWNEIGLVHDPALFC